jgi:hypothetical protein
MSQVRTTATIHKFVMSGQKREAHLRAYVPGIHVFLFRLQDVDGRDARP